MRGVRPGPRAGAGREAGGVDGEGKPGGLRLVSLEEVREAARRLAGVVRRTPLVRFTVPARGSGGAETEVWLKCENLQHVSAFKVRGAYHFVSRLDEEERGRGLVTYSSGNHAQGVAFAARAFGTKATIVMPVDTPRVKLEGTLALGAAVERVGTTTPERRARAEEILRERGGTMVPPFDHPDVIAGQGTVGLEIVEQVAGEGEGRPVPGEGRARAPVGRGDGGLRPGLVLVPVGGGGLISGISAAVRSLVPEARVVGVEPEGAASMKASLEAGRPVTLERAETVADGLKPVRPGDWTFHHCRKLVEAVVTVSDEEIREAVVWLFRRRLVVEPSGAAAVAALLAGRVAAAQGDGGATVAVLSGGNVDPALLCRWLGP